jgi:hypothetical protein
MAASGKNRRGARRHLIDVSDAVEEREDRGAWLAQSSTTLTQRRPLETSGQVGVVIEPEEYEEYSRLKNGAARDRPASTDGPSATPPPDRPDAGRDGAVQDVASFLAQLATPTSADVGTGDEPESEDDFLAQISRAPARPEAAPPRRSGSAALEGVATVRHTERRPSAPRLRSRLHRRWRWVGMTVALLAVVGGAALLKQPPIRTASSGSASAVSHAAPDAFASVRGTLAAIDGQVTRAAQDVVQRERADIAAERIRAARQRASRRRSAVRIRAREHLRAHHAGTRSHAVDVTATATQLQTTTASPTAAPTQTVTAPVTTTPTTSQPTSKQNSDPTKTVATPPYGEGGVLGAGHMSGGS